MGQLIQLAPAQVSSPHSGPLIDTFGRVHSDLRISLTDRCNIRCFYCMPEQGGEFAPVSSLLSFEEISYFVSVALPLGIQKIRLTGGEPLLRPKIAELIASLVEFAGVQDLALTTNAVLLAQHAKSLYDAGLRRLNIHLDTLDRERFRQIRLHLLETLCEELLEAGRYAQAIEAGYAAVCGEPLRESAYRALIRAHLAEGNTSEAIRQYERFRELLKRELDLEP